MVEETRIEVLIDLSNACRDCRLGDGSARATLGRVHRLLRAWEEQFGFQPKWLGVADANLRFLLDRGDRAQFAAWVRAGVVEESASDADERLLELAGDLGAALLSNDVFKGHRRRHPWIQGNTRDFVGWQPTGAGDLLSIRNMGVRSDSTISAAQEDDLLKERRLRGHPSVLGSSYRCDTQSCLYHQFSPDQLQTLPAVSKDGRIVCPGCAAELVVLGERPAATELKLSSVDQSMEVRWLLEEERTVILGRGVGVDADLSPLIKKERRELVSRRHLELTVDSGRLFATDLGSTNGTELFRSEHLHRTNAVGLRMVAGAPTEVGVRDRIVLSEVLAIARSGQRFPPGRPSVPARFRDGAQVGVTRAT